MHSCFSSALVLVGLTAEMQAGFALFSSILQSSVTRFRLFNEYELIQKIINFFTILLLDSYISFFFFAYRPLVMTMNHNVQVKASRGSLLNAFLISLLPHFL